MTVGVSTTCMASSSIASMKKLFCAICCSHITHIHMYNYMQAKIIKSE